MSFIKYLAEMLKKKIKSKYNINYLLIVLASSILLSNLSLKGFLEGHEGFAGPHLLSGSLNSTITQDGVISDLIFEKNSGAKGYSIYNHHPPLSFWIYGNLLKYFKLKSSQLTAAYFFSTFLNLIGLLILFKALIRLKLNYDSRIFITFSVLGTFLVSRFLNLATFDSFSIISASTLSIFFLDSNAEKRFSVLWVLLIISLLFISWYNHLFLYSFFIFQFFKKGLKSFIYSDCLKYILCFIPSSIFIILLQYNGILNFKGLSVTQEIFVRGFGENNYSDLGVIKSIIFFFSNLIKATPFIVLIFLLKNRKKIKLKNSIIFNSNIAAILAFFLIDFSWNIRHPFILLYLIIFSVFYISQIINWNEIINRKIVLIQILFTLLILSNSFYRDYKESTKNAYLLKIIDNNIINNETSYNMKYQDISIMLNNNEDLNFGRLSFILCYPNKIFNDQNKQSSQLSIKNILGNEKK